MGPGEFQSPGRCFALAADTVLVFDRALRRFVVVPPRGPLATLAFPAALGGGWFEASGVDELGALVLEGRAVDGRSRLFRWNRRTGAIDSSGTIVTGDVHAMASRGVSLRRELPFSPRSVAVAEPSIGIAVVVPGPVFRVDVLRGTATRMGSEIPYTPVAVDDGDIEQYIAANAPPAGTTGVNAKGEPVTVGERRWTLANFGLTRDDFPSTKPPFDPAGVLPSPDGTVWIRVHRPSAERADRYEVWDTKASRRLPAVTLQPGQRLAGVGRRGIAYVVTTNSDGVQTVLRVTPGR
jgi:hypothetical protein